MAKSKLITFVCLTLFSSLFPIPHNNTKHYLLLVLFFHQLSSFTSSVSFLTLSIYPHCSMNSPPRRKNYPCLEKFGHQELSRSMWWLVGVVKQIADSQSTQNLWQPYLYVYVQLWILRYNKNLLRAHNVLIASFKQRQFSLPSRRSSVALSYYDLMHIARGSLYISAFILYDLLRIVNSDIVHPFTIHYQRNKKSPPLFLIGPVVHYLGAKKICIHLIFSLFPVIFHLKGKQILHLVHFNRSFPSTCRTFNL